MSNLYIDLKDNFTFDDNGRVIFYRNVNGDLLQPPKQDEFEYNMKAIDFNKTNDREGFSFNKSRKK
jgi:hypothetical protein